MSTDDRAWRDALTLATDLPVTDGGVPSRRARLALAGYRLRAQTRATPHGLFAGTSLVEVGDPAVRSGSAHQTLTRPDGDWLGAFVRSHETVPEVLVGLTVAVNPAAALRGGAYHCQVYEAESRVGRVGYQVRHNTVPETRAVAAVLAAVPTPRTPVTTVLASVRTITSVADKKILRLIGSLVTSGVLLTDLWPEPGTSDPLAYLIERLPAGLQASLAAARSALRAVDTAAWGDRAIMIEDAAAALSRTGVPCGRRPLRTDTAADTHVTVPSTVLEAAARAASLLAGFTARLGPGPVARWTRRFRQRYGTQPVPLLAAFDDVTGIGPLDSEPAATEPGSAQRTAALAHLVASADPQRNRTVELEPDIVAALTGESRTDGGPPSLELHAHLLADDVAAIREGHWRLAVSPWSSGQQAGASVGRVAALFPQYSTPAEPDRAAINAELVCRPTSDALLSVAAAPGWWPHRITVGLVPSGAAAELDVADLVVRAAADGSVHLERRTDGRPVVVTMMSRANADLLPPLARLILFLSQARGESWSPFSWGPYRHHPFLPRLTHGPLILSPASWRIPAEVTTAAGTPCWVAAVRDWRTTAHLPRNVVAGRQDRRMTVDLDDADHLQLLQREVAAGAEAVCEPPGGAPGLDGWLGRSHELVFGLHREPALNARGHEERGPLVLPHRRACLPGGEWVTGYLRQPEHLHDLTLGRLAPRLPKAAITGWHFLRYREAEFGPHLRLRLRAAGPQQVPEVIGALHALAVDLVQAALIRDLTVATYEPEMYRYGGDLAMPYAEAVMTTDSVLALADLALPDEQRLVAGSLAVLTLTAAIQAGATGEHVTGGDLRRWIGEVRLTSSNRHRASAVRAQVRHAAEELAASRLDIPDAAMADLVAAATSYGEVLGRTGTLTVPPWQVAASLAHLACNRRFGGDRDTERVVLALAADAAETLSRTRVPSVAQPTGPRPP